MTYSPPVGAPLAPSRSIICLPIDANFCPTARLIPGYTTIANSSTWTTANTAVIYRFMVREACTVYKLGWYNGSSAGGDSCIALYDPALARLVTTGAVTRVTNSVMQWIDTADTALTPGNLYYAAMNHSATTANHVSGKDSGTLILGALILGGVQQQAVGATALPDPLVPATASVVRTLPGIFLAIQSGIA